MWQKLCLLVGIALCNQIYGANAAEITVAIDREDKLGFINIFGRIEQGDDRIFRERVFQILEQGSTVFRVNIFSVGGNVRAAMGIGDQVRLLQSQTQAPNTFANQPQGNVNCWFSNEDRGVVVTTTRDTIQYNTRTRVGNASCTCASACFLIWASGTVRNGNVVGVHRPYFDPHYFGQLTAKDAKNQYQEMLADYRAYLLKMEIPATIIDRMLATDSNSLHFLDDKELRLVQSVPYLEELVRSRCGNQKGSAPEYRSHWQFMPCARNALVELMRAGANAYLAQYR